MIKTLFAGSLLSLLLFMGNTACFSAALVGAAAPVVTSHNGNGTAPPARRVALIIGNAAYGDRPLHTARADGQAMTRLLGTLGFDVLSLEDATRSDMRAALDAFNRRRDTADVVLFYFAGHAVRRDGSALLLPVDAHLDSPATLRGVDIREVVSALASDHPRQTTVILVDACLNDPVRGNPFPGDRLTAVSHLPAQTLIAFGSSPGGNAFEGTSHGLFTGEILRLLPQTDVALRDIFGRVRHNVEVLSAGAQNPWYLSSLDSAFYLATASTTADMQATYRQQLATNPAGLQSVELGLPRGLLPQDGEARIELEFWKSIENSTDASDYEAYLKAYPEGRFAALAKARAERYKKTAAPAEPAVEDMDIEYVAITDANLRRAPSSQAELAGRLGKGSRVHITGRVADGKWYRIKTTDGDTAYVYADLVDKPAPARPPAPPSTPPVAATPPVVATPPAPTAAPMPTPVAVKTESVQDCPACPVMIVLPAGRYTMGDSNGDRSEKPAHTVSIGRPFAISKYEITTGQWKECVAAGQCSFKAETSGSIADTPVRDISWNDTQQYIRWLSQITKQTYRLPTEAEWEYAARAGTQSRFWWGDQIGTGHANCKNCGGPWAHATPEVVTTFPPNPFGLYGMNGGVWEWVSDCWNKSHEGAPADGRSRDQSDCREHVIRGGSWRDDAIYVHSASRFKYDTNVRYLMNGFRVAKTLP